MKSSWLIFCVLAISRPLWAHPEVYAVDPQHSTVNFVVRAVFTPVHGSFIVGSGMLRYDPDEAANCSVNAAIPIASLDTRVPLRDRHLTSLPGWFRLPEFPVAHFRSTAWSVVDKHTYRIRGQLSVNGVEREVVLAARYLGTGTDIEGRTVSGWEATTRLTRQDWLLTADSGVVGSDVELVIGLQGVLEAPPKA